MTEGHIASVSSALTFFRLAIAEMRRLADEHPDAADQLRVIADKSEAEIAALAEYFLMPGSEVR